MDANGWFFIVVHSKHAQLRGLGISDLEEIQITVGFALEDDGRVRTLVFTVVVLFVSVSGLVP